MDVVDHREFYATALGRGTARLLAQAVRPSLQPFSGQTVLGLGYAAPYLEMLVPESCTRLAFMQARQGVIHWPAEGPVTSALVDECNLPLLESSADHVLVVHGLEQSEAPLDMLREIWRVLAPQGKLVLAVSNRRGLWSASERSPFGFGQPFSLGQLAGLLKQAQFSAVTFRHALLMPPSRHATMLKAAPVIEKIGRAPMNRFAGVIVMEAVKQVYAFSSGKRVRKLVPQLRPVLLPSPRPAAR